jgi:hypothetical protein
MAATLTLADLAATPTGATATIAGSAGGANAVFVSHGDPAVPGVSAGWVEKGARAGDGDVTLSLRPGVYWAYLSADGGAELTPPVYVRVTDGLGAVASRCLAAVRDRVTALALPCTERVYDQTFTDDPAVLYPLTVVTPAGARQSNEAALNGRDDWGHPVRVLIRDKVFQYDQTARTKFEGWRQAVLRAFHNQRLPGVPESVVCRVDLGPLVEPPPGGNGKLMSELTVRCITREPRGLGA